MEDKPTVEESLILVSIGANCAARESMLLPCRSSLFSACFNLESQQLEENADWAWCRLEDPGPKAASQCIRIYPNDIFSSMCCMKMSWNARILQEGRTEGWLPRNVLIVEPGLVPQVWQLWQLWLWEWSLGEQRDFTSSITKVMRPTRSCGAEGMEHGEHGEHDRKCVENGSTTCTQEFRNWE